MKRRYLFFVLMICARTYSQFIAIDSISEKKITDVALYKNYLYYGTDEGKFIRYDINKKTTEVLGKKDFSITDINIDDNATCLSSGNNISIQNNKTKEENTLVATNKINVSKSYQGDIFYGGKSGILYKYNIAKNETTEILSTKDHKAVYWITSISIAPELDKIFICAGDLYTISLSDYKLLSIIKDPSKKIYTSDCLNKSIYISNSGKNNISVIENKAQKEIYNQFSYLIKPISDTEIVLSPSDETFIYDYKKKIKTQLLSKEYAINAVSLKDTLFVNYGNKIVIYENHKSLTLKATISFSENSLNQTDSVSAKKVISRLNYILSKNIDKIHSLKINGYSDGTNENLKELALQRAIKIKGLLTCLPAGKIQVQNYSGVNQQHSNARNSSKNRVVSFEIVMKNGYDETFIKDLDNDEFKEPVTNSISGKKTFTYKKDMPAAYTNEGYIQNIDYGEKRMLINFINKDNVESEVVQFEDGTLFFDNKKKPLTIDEFKSNCKVQITGERLMEHNKNIAKTVTLVDIESYTRREGHVDYIKDDLALVDGYKVRLKPGQKIEGKKKSPYEGYIYDGVNNLKPGILATIDGTFDTNNDCISASKFVIAPDTNDQFDNAITALDKENYEKLAPVWDDKIKRNSIFGYKIPDVGTIVNDSDLQDYVNKVGQKLVPEYLSARIKLIFIVVDNPEASANITANGLAYVNTGLLKILDNEAQLATVLAHEIAHVLYKHTDDQRNKKNNADKKNNGAALLAKVHKWEPGVVKNGVGLDGKTIETNSTKNVTEFKKKYIDKRVAKFTIDQEFQADRVGLALMVLAGYDPREAPILWKNQIIGYDNSDVKPTGKDIKEQETQEEKSTSETALNLFSLWKTEDNKAKILETHPDEIERFEELNNLIFTMWGNEEILKKTQIGEKSYLKIKKKLKNFSHPGK